MSHVALERGPREAEVHARSARLGMWVFLGSEAMLFAALLALYAAYRAAYPGAFAAGVIHSERLMGSVNTVALLTASWLAAEALELVKGARPRAASLALAGAAALGVVFLALKTVEYARHIRLGAVPGPGYAFAPIAGAGGKVYFALYYAATGLHALHVAIGVCVLGWVAMGAWRGRYGPRAEEHAGLEMGALYWHFVDVMWLFLWPLFYLVR